MKRTVYKMQLSDGTRLTIEEQNPGIAIETALYTYPGRTVTGCYSGMTDRDAKEAREQGIDKMALAGFINHEIPEHVAMTEEQAKAMCVRVRRVDHTVPMFTDAETKCGALAK